MADRIPETSGWRPRPEKGKSKNKKGRAAIAGGPFRHLSGAIAPWLRGTARNAAIPSPIR